MKTVLTSFGALILLGIGASSARAQYACPMPPGPPIYCPIPPPRAPDAYGPGYYAANAYGLVYGPNYTLYPPFLPFQGMLPIPGCPGSAPRASPSRNRSAARSSATRS